MSKIPSQDYGLYFWSHLIIILAIWTSPVWLPWYLVLAGVLLYYLQLVLFGDCVLSMGQFNTRARERTFYQHYLEKMGVKVDGRRLVIFLDYVLPWLLVGAAYVIQTKRLIW